MLLFLVKNIKNMISFNNLWFIYDNATVTNSATSQYYEHIILRLFGLIAINSIIYLEH